MIKLIDLLREAKQVGTLYHSTSGTNLISILKSNTLKAGYPVFRFGPGGIQKQISFTRNKNYRPGEYTLEIDGNKLSENYKLTPYDESGNFGRRLESEEVVTEDIINISKYIITIYANVEAVEQEPYKEFEQILKLYPSLSFTIGGKVLVGDTIERSGPVMELPKQEAITYIKYNKY
jgi:hypothetical protein